MFGHGQRAARDRTVAAARERTRTVTIIDNSSVESRCILPPSLTDSLQAAAGTPGRALSAPLFSPPALSVKLSR
jgi:hypothetical protein